MSDQNLPSLRDIADAATAMKEVAPKTVNATDNVASTVINWFHDVVLSPLRRASIKSRYKEKCFAEQFTKHTQKIPLECIQEPKLLIAGPTLEALKYTIDEQELREMFVKLLAASVDKRMNNTAHPAFVEIIKQLSPLDAKFLKIFCVKSTYPVVTVYERHEDGTQNQYFQDIFDLFDSTPQFDPIEQISLTMSLNNLVRLGVVVKDNILIEHNYDYDSFKKHWQYIEYEKAKSNKDDELIMKKFRIELTELGRALKRCCLDD